MNAKEFWISKYPDAEEDWGKTGHDDRFQVRMMEEYAEYRVKNCLIADVVGSLPDDEIRQVFMNNFDCYAEADTPDGLVSEHAMTQQKFVDTIKGMKQ
tara:strand:+ start:2776 stop:3069 length:294 start_codon:yes stop_codon:yes gene_type:complete